MPSLMFIPVSRHWWETLILHKQKPTTVESCISSWETAEATRGIRRLERK